MTKRQKGFTIWDFPVFTDKEAIEWNEFRDGRTLRDYISIGNLRITEEGLLKGITWLTTHYSEYMKPGNLFIWHKMGDDPYLYLFLPED